MTVSEQSVSHRIIPVFAIVSYHQEVGLGCTVVPRSVENAATLQVFWQRYTQVGIIKSTKILGLGRVRGTHLSRVDRELGLTESSLVDQLFSCNACQICTERVSRIGVAYCRYHPRLAPNEDCVSMAGCERPWCMKWFWSMRQGEGGLDCNATVETRDDATMWSKTRRVIW